MLLIHAASLLILAVTFNLDSFGVGMIYGLRRLRIPWTSIVIISVCFGLTMLLSVQVGNVLVHILSARVAQWIGSLILILIGCWVVWQFFQRPSKGILQQVAIFYVDQAAVINRSAILHAEERTTNLSPITRLLLPNLEPTMQVRKIPRAVGINRFGTISATETAWLGVALSFDAFGAGIGTSLLGYPVLMTAIVIAFCSGVFLRLGIYAGSTFAERHWLGKLSFVPGMILIIMGLIKLLS